MGQASVNVKAMLRERLAGAEAEVALLEALIEYVDQPSESLGDRRLKRKPPQRGQCKRRCSKCRRVQWVSGSTKHCPLCKAHNSLKIHDG